MKSVTVNPVVDFWNFLRRPAAENLSVSIRRKLVIVLTIVALDILISLATNPLTELMIGISGFDDSPVDVPVFNLIDLLTGSLLVPFVEEIYFRLGLAPNILFLFVSLFLSTVQYAPFPSGLFGGAELGIAVRVLFYLALSGGISLFFWIRQRKGHSYAQFFKRNVAIYYYIGAVWFGLAHIGNYTHAPPWWLAVFLAGEQGGAAWLIFLIVLSLVIVFLPAVISKRFARPDEFSA